MIQFSAKGRGRTLVETNDLCKRIKHRRNMKYVAENK